MDSIEVSLFLIGDAGSKAYDGEPVLRDLAKQSDSLRAVKQYVVFLGDNVYPRGVPPLGSPTRDDAERKIRAQVVAIRRGKAQGLLIPGNHDWDRQGRDGWNSIRRMDTVVAKFGGKDVRLLPKGGCPGPEVVDLGPAPPADRARQRVVGPQRRQAVRARGALPHPDLPGGDRLAAGRAARRGRPPRAGADPSPAPLRRRARRLLHLERSHLPAPEHPVVDVAPPPDHRLDVPPRPPVGDLQPGHLGAQVRADAPGVRGRVQGCIHLWRWSRDTITTCR